MPPAEPKDSKRPATSPDADRETGSGRSATQAGGGSHRVTRPEVLLFDLDGTLTEPLLDFSRIRRDMGIAAGRPILEAMLEMGEAERARVNDILLRHEHEAAVAATLNPGCRELLGWAAGEGIPMAIITRNSLPSTQVVLQTHGLMFEVLVTREDEPYKPNPDPIWLALQRLGSSARGETVWMVGDGEHDIEAGNAAGVRTVWVSHGKPREFKAEPWLTVVGLDSLRAMLGR